MARRRRRNAFPPKRSAIRAVWRHACERRRRSARLSAITGPERFRADGRHITCSIRRRDSRLGVDPRQGAHKPTGRNWNTVLKPPRWRIVSVLSRQFEQQGGARVASRAGGHLVRILPHRKTLSAVCRRQNGSPTRSLFVARSVTQPDLGASRPFSVTRPRFTPGISAKRPPPLLARPFDARQPVARTGAPFAPSAAPGPPRTSTVGGQFTTWKSLDRTSPPVVAGHRQLTDNRARPCPHGSKVTRTMAPEINSVLDAARRLRANAIRTRVAPPQARSCAVRTAHSDIDLVVLCRKLPAHIASRLCSMATRSRRLSTISRR